jgi:two-component system, NtrC family, response regulator AtoC
VGWDLASTQEELERSSNPAALTLVVVAPDGVRTIVLPASGTLGIGRSPENQIAIDDPAMSRQHAALHVGAAIELEDLGSANGSRVQGVTLESGSKRALAVGEAFDLGSTLFVVQRSAPPKKKKIQTHSYLEARMEEECARRGVRPRFVLLRIAVDGRISEPELEQALTADLRPGDVVAAYAPKQIELLLFDATRSRAEAIANAIREQLAPHVRIGMAIHPDDGVSADALIGVVTAQLEGEAPHDADTILVDPTMKDLHRIVDRVALGSISILLLGETGVGKEVIAEAIHHRSPRAGAPFVRLNCAALSEALVESELFGHEKGAFTGADQAKVGLMETASGGTLFLDEVGELPLATQAKLLRAIEQREILRVGGIKPRAIDARLVSATNRDLEGEVRAGRFRSDLYYRLNGVTLVVPPLRQRPAEIEPLARLFLARCARQLAIEAPEIGAAAIALLARYAWPGNIRELKNVVERALLLSSGEAIEPLHLPFEKMNTAWPAPERSEARDEDPRRAEIVEALEKCAGNQTRAAELLGISRQTLVKWLDKYNFPRPQKGS